MKTAKVFKHGNGQAVRLLPRKITYEQVMAILGGFKDRIKRRQPRDQNRKVEMTSSLDTNVLV